MRIQFRAPSGAEASTRLQALAVQPVTYWERGGSGWERLPQGYQHADEKVCLGQGENCWRLAGAIFRQWAFLPAYVSWCADNQTPGGQTQYLMDCRKWGLHWTFPVRVVDRVQDANRFVLAIGTLPGHIAQGEERFELYRDEADKVWFRIRVMSRLAWTPAKLVPRLFARVQQQFRTDCRQQFAAQLELQANKQVRRQSRRRRVVADLAAAKPVVAV